LLQFHQFVDKDRDVLQRIVTGDESWCFQFSREMQRRRVKQHRTNSPLQKKVRLKKLHVKTMPNVFFNADRIMHSKFVHEGTTVNSHYYLGVMECPHACMRHVSNRQFHGNSLLLSHDMPTHCTLNEKQFLASKSIHV
jgi:hypothetical protein